MQPIVFVTGWVDHNSQKTHKQPFNITKTQLLNCTNSYFLLPPDIFIALVRRSKFTTITIKQERNNPWHHPSTTSSRQSSSTFQHRTHFISSLHHQKKIQPTTPHHNPKTSSSISLKPFSSTSTKPSFLYRSFQIIAPTTI